MASNDATIMTFAALERRAMIYTYASLRELAKPVVVTVSLDRGPLEVLTDALIESGVLCYEPDVALVCPIQEVCLQHHEVDAETAAFVRECAHQFALRWAMRAVYGEHRIGERVEALRTLGPQLNLVRRSYWIFIRWDRAVDIPFSMKLDMKSTVGRSHAEWTCDMLRLRMLGLPAKTFNAHCPQCDRPIVSRYKLCYRCSQAELREKQEREWRRDSSDVWWVTGKA